MQNVYTLIYSKLLLNSDWILAYPNLHSAFAYCPRSVHVEHQSLATRDRSFITHRLALAQPKCLALEMFTLDERYVVDSQVTDPFEEGRNKRYIR